jgi:hypothetical protein
MEQKLDNKEYVFTLLTAIIKRSGGEIRVTKEELLDVFKEDAINLLWDKKSEEIVLQVASMIIDYTTVPDESDN